MIRLCSFPSFPCSTSFTLQLIFVPHFSLPLYMSCHPLTFPSLSLPYYFSITLPPKQLSLTTIRSSLLPLINIVLSSLSSLSTAYPSFLRLPYCRSSQRNLCTPLGDTKDYEIQIIGKRCGQACWLPLSGLSTTPKVWSGWGVLKILQTTGTINNSGARVAVRTYSCSSFMSSACVRTCIN